MAGKEKGTELMIEGSARGNPSPGVEALTVRELSPWAPEIVAVLRQMGVPVDGHENMSLLFLCEEAGIDPVNVFQALSSPNSIIDQGTIQVKSLKIISGKNKKGRQEPVKELVIKTGEIVALVGPTGSGKSQMLSDVESLARGDSPSRRTILVNGVEPPEDLRWSSSVRPIALISQSMSFLLDLTVGEFLEMHIASKASDDSEKLKMRVINAACTLCGEPFGLEHQIVSLSGGQSRTLMIADAVLVSKAPIILVDEIENAGIDRDKAMKFLVGEGKISLVATHDPLLALRANKRVVLENGAMKKVVVRSKEELAVLSWLEKRKVENTTIRDQLRSGQQLSIP